MKIGFIGLGNVGSKLSGSLIRNGHGVTVLDLNPDRVAEKITKGAKAAESAAHGRVVAHAVRGDCTKWFHAGESIVDGTTRTQVGRHGVSRGRIVPPHECRRQRRFWVT